MDSMDASVVTRVMALIDRYELHHERSILPVPIKQVAKDEGWEIFYHSKMGSAVAMAFVVEPVKLMYLNVNLTLGAQRVGIAHEMGHVLAGHRLSADTWMTSGHEHEGLQGVDERQEREAKLIACMLLIPPFLRDAPLTDREVSELCIVTPAAVRNYRQAAVHPMMELTG